MRFYKIVGTIEKVDYEYEEKYESLDQFIRHGELDSIIFSKTKHFNDELDKKAYFVISEINSEDVSICALVDDDIDLHDESLKLLGQLKISVNHLSVDEATFSKIREMLHMADINSYIADDNEVLHRCGLQRVYDRHSFRSSLDFEELIIDPPTQKAETARLRRLLTAKDLKDEIARIKELKEVEGVQGHPVHYMIQADDKHVQEKTLGILLGNLSKYDRIYNKRISILNFSPRIHLSRSFINGLYDMNKGGTIVVSLMRFCGFEGNRANNTLEFIETLCESMKEHRNEVLTVLLCPKECTQLKSHLFENLGTLSFVEIMEQSADAKRAKQLLRTMAKDNKVPSDKTLYAKIEAEETYLTNELRVMFEEWLSKKLRTEVYPQYAQFRMAKTEKAKEEVKGNAHDELMSMIGLTEAKKIIDQAIDFHKMQKFLAAQDIVRERPSQHMIFTGNPGTAKTTVARLFARIMRENELLSSGHIVEVGRADLVGKYVGHTAPRVKQCFNKAKGGVLFIDEAYSLVDDRDGCFGDEAINTIVQEMENNRDNVVVIFAGYPDKMEQFLLKNPGLRSRIAFHVPFPDYTPEELCEISLLVAQKKEMRLSEDATSKLLNIFQNACAEEDFGNGRFVRSAIEKAIMAQSSRIIKKDLESLTKTELSTILAEDIEEPASTRKKITKLGFCA